MRARGACSGTSRRPQETRLAATSPQGFKPCSRKSKTRGTERKAWCGRREADAASQACTPPTDTIPCAIDRGVAFLPAPTTARRAWKSTPIEDAEGSGGRLQTGAWRCARPIYVGTDDARLRAVRGPMRRISINLCLGSSFRTYMCAVRCGPCARRCVEIHTCACPRGPRTCPRARAAGAAGGRAGARCNL